MSHVWMSHVTHMNEACHTYDWVMSHVQMRHVTHMNQSWLTHACDVTHACDMTLSYVCHDSLICVAWLIHLCAMSHSYVCHPPFPGIEPSLQGSAWHEIDGVPVHARAGQEVVSFRFSKKCFQKNGQEVVSFMFSKKRIEFFCLLKMFHEIHCVPVHVHAGQRGFIPRNKERLMLFFKFSKPKICTWI